MPAPQLDFEQVRPRLVRLAYRMLGSVADAEDVVQDAYLRWLRAAPQDVASPEAYLRTIVTRLSLNQLKSARRQRETYIGPWLPEPVFEPEDSASPDDVILPLMMALERLTPLERGAFLLHDVFGLDFGEVARTLQREPAACRKLASRARAHIRAARPRFPLDAEEGQRIARAFFLASRQGDMRALRDLLSADVVARADGGGRVQASVRPLVGRAQVLARHREMADGFARAPSALLRYGMINGLPGFITREEGNVLQSTALLIDKGRIVAIYVTRNPDKLRGLPEGGLLH